ncbi:50S ribosomal protein L11 methyltransferase [candidate division KSB1 bacterium]|nr:50S ribosomal protein L11 methyltransferase [candidate division KSB1 bacterium]
MTSWIRLRIAVNDEIREAIENRLFESGCSGCQEEAGFIVAYFDSKTDEKWLLSQITQYCSSLNELGFRTESTPISVEQVQPEDWNSAWKKNYKPFHVGERFIVKPTWLDYREKSSRQIIEIDPKMAFGTGLHETTQMMIRLMEIYFKGGERVLDIGTGTGILSIAAKFLGAKKVIAFDNDPVAADCVRENLIQNNANDVVMPFIGTIESLKPARFDVILANINKMILLELAQEMAKRLKKPGILILSGLLLEQASEICSAFKKINIVEIQKLVWGEWEALALQHE